MSTRSATDGARGVRLFASMVVAVAVLTILSYRGGTDRIAVTGTVVDFRSGESITIANDQVVTLRLELDRTTRYETADSRSLSDSSAVSLGSHATVWYRSTDERRRVVDRVRVIPDRTSQ
ncbi:MAG: hypothetical protein IT305_29330 [Chloroflexi bacterium]|nr:hypothetical protein [Chloroflexota bacterium]